MAVIERFLEATKEIWDGYNSHSFVKGIENGTLEQKKFRYYILQDYLYLIEYAKVFAIGMAKAKSFETRKLFSDYIRCLSDSEMDTHRGYMGKLKITQEEMEAGKPALENISYTSYMLRVAYEEGETEILAAILSCAYSYEVIAKRMLKNNPKAAEHPFYGAWVKEYTNEEYHEENQVLIKMLEKLADGYTESKLEHLVEIFVICSRYEAAFWDMAWKS